MSIEKYYLWDCPFKKLIKKYPLMRIHIERIASNYDDIYEMKVLIHKNRNCGYQLLDYISYYVTNREGYMTSLTETHLYWVKDDLPLSVIYDKINDVVMEEHKFENFHLIKKYAIAFSSKNIYFEDTEQMVKYQLMMMNVA